MINCIGAFPRGRNRVQIFSFSFPSAIFPKFSSSPITNSGYFICFGLSIIPIMIMLLPDFFGATSFFLCPVLQKKSLHGLAPPTSEAIKKFLPASWSFTYAAKIGYFILIKENALCCRCLHPQLPEPLYSCFAGWIYMDFTWVTDTATCSLPFGRHLDESQITSCLFGFLLDTA